MPTLLKLILTLSSFLGVTKGSIASGSLKRQEATAPMPPKQDPWYTAPWNYETAAPGTIFRIRNAADTVSTDLVANASEAYNVLYRTTDSHLEPAWAVTTLFVPLSKSNGCTESPLLTYAIPYDSADLNASPSSQLGWRPDISDALGRGWYVNVPDYEGPLAAFTAGAMSGFAILDSVRAVLSSSSPTNNTNVGVTLPNTTRHAVWGFSGGAYAAAWAAELQPEYAPDLSFSGVALGSTVTDIRKALNNIDDSMLSGIIPQALFGFTAQYPDLRDMMLSKLKENDGVHNATLFRDAVNMNLNMSSRNFGGQVIAGYFESGFGFFDDPSFAAVLAEDGALGFHGAPSMPVYAYHSLSDSLSKIEDIDALIDGYCNAGSHILYERNTNTQVSHLSEEVSGRHAARDWLSSVLEKGSSPGYPLQKGCTIRDVDVPLAAAASF